ncbi:MAG: fibronectin type III domain-containing protein [Desulfobacteraceae bacterium]|nr:fibronectin type III domain-containing protein [Desulfobacteraceae bacterium]
MAWDPVNEADHYRIYPREAGESYDYQNDYETSQTNQYTLTGFDQSKTYYFVVRAMDANGNQSSDSNEVCWDPSGTGKCAQGVNYSLGGGGSASSGGAGGCFLSTFFGD